MARQWSNWILEDKKILRELFDESIKIHGKVKIITVLDHVSSSGMTRNISAFLLLLDAEGAPTMHCIARERRVTGCGMDMGFDLAYNMFCSVYGVQDPEHPYQEFLEHCWL